MKKQWKYFARKQDLYMNKWIPLIHTNEIFTKWCDHISYEYDINGNNRTRNKDKAFKLIWGINV